LEEPFEGVHRGSSSVYGAANFTLLSPISKLAISTVFHLSHLCCLCVASFSAPWTEFNAYIRVFRNIFLVRVMSSFVVFGNWTEQGIKKVSEAPKRIKETRGMIEKAGGKMQLFYTAGKYDFVMIVEIPKDDDLMAILLCIGSMGNIRTMTMKAWTEAEGAKILSAPHP
jgi:uncharacterized protein with GYD domain